MDLRYLRGRRERVAEIGEAQVEEIHTLEGTTQRAQMDLRRGAQESTLEKQLIVITMGQEQDQKSLEAGERRLLRQVECNASRRPARVIFFFSVPVQYHSVSPAPKKWAGMGMAEDIREYDRGRSFLIISFPTRRRALRRNVGRHLRFSTLQKGPACDTMVCASGGCSSAVADPVTDRVAECPSMEVGQTRDDKKNEGLLTRDHSPAFASHYATVMSPP